MTSPQLILAIETSCDETGVALVHQEGEKISVLSSALASQTDIHQAAGGVVPEAAAREHTQVIRPLLQRVLSDAVVKPADITALAVTVGPGLQPALAVGVTAARTLAFAWHKPIIPVHHLEGHVYSALLQAQPIFPALGLIVSGGHTMLLKMSGHVRYEVIGTTQDDAAGEAFDKVARLLGLPYPGGPQVSRLAESGDPTAFNFPRPMHNSGDYNFSFSGLKTAVLYTLKKNPAASAADVAASFQAAAVDSLVTKTVTAAVRENVKTVLLAGGVAANQKLRHELSDQLKAKNLPLRIAPLELTGDNAVMIGQAALFARNAGRRTAWSDIDASARLDLQLFSAGVS